MIKYLLLVLLTSCANEVVDTSNQADASLIISHGNVFTTTSLTVASGARIAIINRDDSPHTITSQSTEDAFDDSGDFDVVVASNSSQVLTLPTASSGTNFYFYCDYYHDAMTPASGTIVIE